MKKTAQILSLIVVISVMVSIVLYYGDMEKQVNIGPSPQEATGNIALPAGDKGMEKVVASVPSDAAGSNTAADTLDSDQAGKSQKPQQQISPGPAPGQVEYSFGGKETNAGEIEERYVSELQSLASSYEHKLNMLASAALMEYNSLKKEKPGADTGPLISKYYIAGKELEAQCDSKVYSLLEAFENELKSNSLPTDAAAAARQTYEARKKNRAAQIVSIR